jgi:hypothetical protein
MPYASSPTDVRELAGGVIAADFSDNEIIEEQETARDIIDLKTARTWSSSDSIWELIVRIENMLSAALVLAHFGPTHKDESERLWVRANQLLETVIGSELTGTTGSGALFSSSNYKSYILGLDDDTDTEPYRSTSERRIY